MCPCFKMSGSFLFSPGSLTNSKFTSCWRNGLSCFVAFLQNFALITSLSSGFACSLLTGMSILYYCSSEFEWFVYYHWVYSLLHFRVCLFVFYFNLSAGGFVFPYIYILLWPTHCMSVHPSIHPTTHLCFCLTIVHLHLCLSTSLVFS
jgi:hypothetical protein